MGGPAIIECQKQGGSINGEDGLEYSLHDLNTRKKQYIKKIPNIEKITRKSNLPTSRKIRKIPSGQRFSQIILHTNELQREDILSQAKVKRYKRQNSTLKEKNKNLTIENSDLCKEIDELRDINIKLGSEICQIKNNHKLCVQPENLDKGLEAFAAKKAREQKDFLKKLYKNFGAQYQEFLKSEASLLDPGKLMVSKLKSVTGVYMRSKKVINFQVNDRMRLEDLHFIANLYSKMEANDANPIMNFDPGVVDFVLELGLGICNSVEECRASLSTVGTQKITPQAIGRMMIGMIKAQDHQNANHGSGQSMWGGGDSSGGKDKDSEGSSWNGKVFVQAVLELVPNLDWKDVFLHLDFPGFSISDGRGYRSLIEALKYGLQLQTRPEQLPIETFYRRWKNVDGQLQLLKCIVNPANMDYFSLTDYPYHSSNVEMLKNTGGSEKNSMELKEIAQWKSLELLDILLHISDSGHYASVHEIFQFPSQNCPDILILGLVQLTSQINMLRQELLGTLFTLLLGNHVNSGAILQHSWTHGSITVRNILITSMVEWYVRSGSGDNHDQTRLSRILDLAQDLKALPFLLSNQATNSHIFMIDLACLASRREFLKLDKWLRDKISDHGEHFISSLVKVIKGRSSIIKDANVPKAALLPNETISIICESLHQCIGKVNSPELNETLHTITTTFNIMMNKRRQTSGQQQSTPPPGVLRPQSSSFPGGSNFPPNSNDPLAALTGTLSGLNLAGPLTSSGGGSVFGGPGSPSRLLGQGYSSQPGGGGGYQIPGLNMQANPSSGSNMSMLSGRLGGGGQAITSSAAIGEKRVLLDNSVIFSDMQLADISKEAEDEANSYFHRIYSKPPDPSMSIDEVLDFLKRFQDSNIKREKEVFTCMLRNLFEEYKFFPQYPEKELHTTAQLFGGIIEHGLVSTYLQLGVALRFVVDALKKPPGSKMYYFGLAALDKFKTKLKEYPQYCQHLTTIPHFQEFPPHLIEYIDFGSRSQDPPRPRTGTITMSSNSSTTTSANHSQSSTASSSQKPVVTSSVKNTLPTSVLSGRPSIANSTNITTLLLATEEEKVTMPPENVQDKTAFIFNNLNQMNLGTKCEELKELIGNEFWMWVSQYLVMKRASIELNFHSLYSNLLDTLKNKELNSYVLKETHRNIKILLRAEKSPSNYADRSLLKNLGHWLGMITLMKNKPIILDDLDVKSLIIEAFRKSLQDLMFVVPFGAKIIESCAKSNIFKPPCPWTMGIISVLAEIHREPDLKLNLKFEIEVLCKALSIDINDVKSKNVLKDEKTFKIRVLQLCYPNKSEQGPVPIGPPRQTSDASKAQTSTSTSDTQQQHPIGPPTSQQTPSSLQSSDTITSTSAFSSAGSLPTDSQAFPGSGSSLQPVGAPMTFTEPKFSYMDVDTGNLSGMLAHIVYSNQLAILQAHQILKPLIRPSIEKAVSDLLSPVVERSIKYTINACEQIIKKDFALDPEENRMRVGAHHMMRYLTAGMAMITSRDHIFIAISTNLKNSFTNALRTNQPPNNSQQIKDLIEQACQVIASENMEIVCVFIQKTAVEKALAEIDKRLAPEYEARKQARNEGRRYCDPIMMAYQMERIPEPVSVKPGVTGNLNQHLAVYEDFSRNIPGFLEGEIPIIPKPYSITPTSMHSSNNSVTPVPIPSLPLPAHSAINNLQQQQSNNPTPIGEELSTIYDKLVGEMEIYISGLSISHSPAAQQLANGARTLLDGILVARSTRSVVAAISLVQKAVEVLLEGLAAFPNDPEIIRFRDAHLLVLKALQDSRGFGQQWVNRQVTKSLIEMRPELKYNVEAVDTVIRANLVNLLQFDAHLAQAIEKGQNLIAMNFAIQLVQMYLVDDRFQGGVTETDLYHTVDTLVKIAAINRNPPEALLNLIESVRNNHSSSSSNAAGAGGVGVGGEANFGVDRVPSTTHIQTGMSQSSQYDDPQGLVEKSEILLREWIRVYITMGTPKDSTKAFASFIQELNNSGILKSDDIITRFFRISVQCCVSNVYQVLQNGPMNSLRGKSYQSIDALVRLVALLIKHIGENVSLTPKINLFNKFLGIVAGILIQDHETQKGDFQQLPFHRLFIMLFYDLTSSDPVFEAISMQVLTGYSNTLHIVNPTKVPGFAYAWLEIIGNRIFIAKMLALAADQKCWVMYCQLLLDLFKFLQPFLRNAELAKPVSILYRGTLRVLLVILHDFPDFLCDYCYHFLDAIPPNCIQMRNLVLSAFPRNMRLPDPFTANLKVEMLADSAMPPRILANVGNSIQPAKFKQDLESYLKTRAPVTFLSELRTNLQITNEMGTRYNIPLMNALVLYVGSQHISVIRSRGHTPSMTTVAHISHMDIFQNLAVDLDTEGRYIFLNSLSNQLRFPSSHTHYFSLVILYLFAQSNTEVVQEQITRVLLERLVVNRPHPWGLLVTFIELIKNPIYKFWQHDFVHCAPEVEKLFESVARSCMVSAKNTPPLSNVPAGLNLSNTSGALSITGGGSANGSGLINIENSQEMLID